MASPETPIWAVCERGPNAPRHIRTAPPMLVTLMKAKLHRATVTQADLDYEGSIAIDADLLDAAGIFPHEQVDVLNITNGARFTTYAIEAPRGSKVIELTSCTRSSPANWLTRKPSGTRNWPGSSARAATIARANAMASEWLVRCMMTHDRRSGPAAETAAGVHEGSATERDENAVFQSCVNTSKNVCSRFVSVHGAIAGPPPSDPRVDFPPGASAPWDLRAGVGVHRGAGVARCETCVVARGRRRSRIGRRAWHPPDIGDDQRRGAGLA